MSGKPKQFTFKGKIAPKCFPSKTTFFIILATCLFTALSCTKKACPAYSYNEPLNKYTLAIK
jgi:hypothetical protein